MIQTLLQWTTFHKILMNTLLVSLPEEFFFIMFAYILMGEFDYWKQEECKKLLSSWDYTRVLIPTITVALGTNIWRYSGFNVDLITPLSIVAAFILVCLLGDLGNDATPLNWMGRAAAFLMLGSLAIGVCEIVTVPPILYATGKTIKEINNDIILNFIVSIPSRVLEYIILVFFVIRRRTFLEANVIKPIVSSMILTGLTLFTIVFDLAFTLIMCKAIAYDRMLANLSFLMQLGISSGVALFSVINITALLLGIYYKENQAIEKQKAASEKLDKLAEAIKAYTGSGKRDNIKLVDEFDEIVNDIKEVSHSLFKAEEKTE